MRKIFAKPGISSVFLFSIIGICIFSCVCQIETRQLNAMYQTSLFDILTFQFNLYSYVHLLFLPLFILAAYKFLKTNKFDDLVITRTDNRCKYFIFREKSALIFSLIYRMMEIALSTIVFVLSSILTSNFELDITSFSPIIQVVLCINPKSSFESLFYFLFAQFLITLLYFVFSQIVILSDLSTNSFFISVSIPIIMNFLLLALIKSNYLFRGSPLYYFLPHNNIYFEFLYGSNNLNYLHTSFNSIVYWFLLFSILLWFVLDRIKRKDFLYPTENVDYERE